MSVAGFKREALKGERLERSNPSTLQPFNPSTLQPFNPSTLLWLWLWLWLLAPAAAIAQTSAIPVNVVLMLPNNWVGQTYSGMTFNPTNQGRTLILWPCTNCGGSGTSIITQVTIAGITNLNGSTNASQTFVVGTSGNDFNIASLAGVHTFNLPTASATVRGALSSADWTTFNSKSNHLVQTNDVDLGSAGTVNWTTGVTGYVSGGVLRLGVSLPASSGTNHLVQTNGVDLGSAGTVNWTAGVTGYVSGGVLHLGMTGAGGGGGFITNQYTTNIAGTPVVGSFWFQGTNGAPVTNNARVAMEWIPVMRSWRLGELGAQAAGPDVFDSTTAPSNYWHPTNVGMFSIAQGSNVMAKGHFSTVLNGVFNIIHSNAVGSSIVGGSNNIIYTNSSFSLMGGGANNYIRMGSDYSTVVGGGGGAQNGITASDWAFIGGGQGNLISSQSDNASIVGGSVNTFSGICAASFIGGGGPNTINTATFATIVGGQNNSILSGGTSAFIGGGNDNDLSTSASESSVVGGNDNDIGNSIRAFIGGGAGNDIGNASDHSFLGGGRANIIIGNSEFGQILGGASNSVSGAMATAIGNFITNATARSIELGVTDANKLRTDRTNTWLLGDMRLRMTNGGTAGHVLTSDATGEGTWQAPTGGSGLSSPDMGIAFVRSGALTATNGTDQFVFDGTNVQVKLVGGVPTILVGDRALLTTNIMESGGFNTPNSDMDFKTLGIARWGISGEGPSDEHGHLFPNANNTYDIGNRAELVRSNVLAHLWVSNTVVLFTGAGAGKVLTSDANGVGTWETPGGSGTNHLVQTNGVDLGTAGTVNWTTGVTGYVSGGVVNLGTTAPRITTLRTTGNQTINAGAATFTDITGLTFPVVNGTDYAFEFYITFQSAATTTGWKAGVNCPAGTLDFWAGSDVIANGAAGVATHTERHNTVRDDMTLLTSTVTAGVDLNVRIRGRYLCTANGTFAARFANELAANTDIVVQKGSYGTYW
jgi:hypothetical protein